MSYVNTESERIKSELNRKKSVICIAFNAVLLANLVEISSAKGHNIIGVQKAANI